MSQRMEDKMNGVVVHHGIIATIMRALARGIGNTAIRAIGATKTGMEAIAQAMNTNQTMTMKTIMPIKGTTRAATAAATLTSRAANPMEPSTPVLTLEVVTTRQPSML